MLYDLALTSGAVSVEWRSNKVTFKRWIFEVVVFHKTFKNYIGCVCTLFHYTHPHHITLESPVSPRQHVVWLGADKWCSKRRVKVKQGHLQTMNVRSCGIPQNFQKWYWMRMYSISLHTSTPYNIGKPSVSASTCCMTWRWQVVQ